MSAQHLRAQLRTKYSLRQACLTVPRRIETWEIVMLGFSRWQLFKGLAGAVGFVSIVSLALIYFVPATPSKVIMATGPKGSSFEYYGRQYRETFAHSNIELELRETTGAAENV